MCIFMCILYVYMCIHSDSNDLLIWRQGCSILFPPFGNVTPSGSLLWMHQIFTLAFPQLCFLLLVNKLPATTQPNQSLSSIFWHSYLWQPENLLDIPSSFILHIHKRCRICFHFFWLKIFPFLPLKQKHEVKWLALFPSNDLRSWMMIILLIRKLTLPLFSFNFILGSSFLFSQQIFYKACLPADSEPVWRQPDKIDCHDLLNQ